MNTLKRLPYYGLMALLVYMPFHIFLSQSLSLLTGGLSVWKVAKDVLLCGLVLIALGLVWWQRLKRDDFTKLLVLTAAYGALHLLVWLINPHIFRQTAFEGVVYNNRILLFAVLGCAAVLLQPKLVTERRLIKITLVVSTLVCVLGLLQYVLPKDVLTHVGYSVARGVKPAFFIDDKPDYPRIMSTLRDPNSLGAYLIVPLCLIYGLLLKHFNEARRRYQLLGLGALHVLALFLTFSRGAWLGALIAFLASAVHMRRDKLRMTRKIGIMLVCSVVVLGGLAFVFRHQRVIENVVRHSDNTTVAKQDSNALHLDFAKKSLQKSFQKPLGHGPGTAGIVSIRNPDGGQLTENYYLQLLYEVGFIGLGLFVYTLIFVTQKVRATTTLLGSSLLVSMIAYAVMAMLMHLWSNEAVAAQWWLLAGVCMGLARRNTRRTVVDK